MSLHQEGYSERAISEKLKFSKTAIHNAIVKFFNSGSYSDSKRSGRPRKMTPREDNAIKRIAVQSPMMPSMTIRLALL